MPDITDVVVFLEETGELALGESPWTTWTEEDELQPIDWEGLFGGAGESDSVLPPFEPDADFMDRLRRAVEERPPGDNLPDGWKPSDGPSDRWPLDGAPGEQVCAWYQPIHFFGLDFGIFIRLQCTLNLMLEIARHLPRDTPVTPVLALQLLRAAIFAFYLHEQYHHKVESLALRLHVTTRQGRYRRYVSSVYRPCRDKDEQIEEALANADSVLRLTEPHYSRKLGPVVRKALRRHLEFRIPFDPPGYRMGCHYLTDEKFDAGENLLQGRVSEAVMTPTQPASDWRIASHLTQSLFRVTDHVWWVVPKGGSPRIPGRAMPVRTCSTRDMIRVCEQHGYRQVSGGKGSHVKMKKLVGGPMIILPGNRSELSPPVARNILKALGNYGLQDLKRLVEAV